MQKILITGANGYLGAQIGKYLSQNGFSVSGLCFPEIPQNEQWQSGFDKLFACDIRDTEKLRQIADNQFDAIVHLVSLDHHQSNGAPDFVTSINVAPTWNLLDIFSKKGLKKFIYFSTIHVYGKIPNSSHFERSEKSRVQSRFPASFEITENYPVNCANFYALTHYLSENICRYYAQNSDVQCVVARLSNSYGEPVFEENNCWWLVVNDLCKMAFENKKIVLQSDGSPLRDFINGNDVCQAVKMLINNGENGKTYHISSGETFSILEIAEKVQNVYQKLYGENLPIFKAENQNINIPKYKIDNGELQKLGFKPEISLEKGIENLFGYLSKKL